MPTGRTARHRGSPEELVRVLAAFGEVSRAQFVPPAATGQAYLDAPIRIPYGQVTTQPSLIARMVAALGPSFVPLVGAHGIRSREGRNQR